MKSNFYLKSIFRKIVSRPLFPLISTIGLTIGFVSTVLVAIWLRDELSYDRFNKNADRVYRLTVDVNDPKTGFHWDFARSWYDWLKNMKKDVPGIESETRLCQWGSGVVKSNDRVYYEDIFYTEPSLTDVFSFTFLRGNPGNCLSKPGEVILSSSTAYKYFGNEEAVGKTIYLYCSRCVKQVPYVITGVFKDTPVNSHVHFNVIASRDNPDEDPGWAYYYLLLQKGTSPGDVLGKFKSFASKYVKAEELAKLTPQLQKITDIHLHSNKFRELEENGSIQQVYFVVGLAIFVLFIMVFNFFTIRYVSLIKEFKSLQLFQFAGAKTKGMYGYQALEALIFGIASAIAAFFIIKLCYPDFNQLIGKHQFAGFQMLTQTSAFSLVLLLVVVVLSGLFPYWVFRASQWMKSRKANLLTLSFSYFSSSGSRSRVLKLLLGIQYISTFVLIICVIVINNQLLLFNRYQLGHSGQKTLCVQEIPCQVINKYQLFKEELLRNPLITEITSSMEDPGKEIEDMMGFETSGIDDDISKKLIYVCPVDDNFFSFYDIKLKAGINFPKFTGNDSVSENFILNEKAVELLGLKNNEEAINKPFRLKNDYVSKKPGRIVGVVSNFQPSTVKKEIKPYVFFQKSYWLFNAQIKFDTAHLSQSLQLVRNTWSKIYPDYPFRYTFVDDLYKSAYKNEFQLRNIGTVLSLLAIILSALGLFGITGIVYEARTKEIGIRKVNGARFGQIAGWLLRDILLVVAIALVVAAPLSWYLMQNWLHNYAYKVSISIGTFLLAGTIILVVALLTVSWQTWRAATRNPVESLRYE